MDPEPAGFIRTSSHYTPAMGIPAHNHRLTTKLRAVPLFHRSVERVHVDVDDLADGLHGGMLIAPHFYNVSSDGFEFETQLKSDMSIIQDVNLHWWVNTLSRL